MRTELSWTHYRLLLRVDNNEAKQWYVNEAVAQNWSSRALDWQIGTLYFERLLLSGDKASVAGEAAPGGSLASCIVAWKNERKRVSFLLGEVGNQ